MKILHIICSPRGHASASAKRSHELIQRLIASDRNSEVTVRCLSESSMPHVDREFALSSRSDQAVDEPFGSRLLSDELIDEVMESDAVVVATPVHNLAVPSTLKAWLDHVVRPEKTFRYVDGKMVGLLPDRPVLVSLSSSFPLPSEDFLRPYVLAMFAAIGISNVEFHTD